MLRFFSRLPVNGGNPVPVTVHEIPPPHEWTGRCRQWMEQVQEPYIALDESRCDRAWKWSTTIPVLTFYGGLRRRPRMFQVCAGLDEFPIGMVALLENERWIADNTQSAVYVWWLAAAPPEALAHLPGLTLVGTATLDVAVTVSLNGPANGRLWLHAEPGGGSPLLGWYGKRGLQPVPAEAYPQLPSSPLMPRANDGRYFFLDETSARGFHASYQPYR